MCFQAPTLPDVLRNAVVFLLLGTSPVLAGTQAPCSSAPPDVTALPALFEKELDATRPFVLEVRMIQPPSGWNVSLVYVARREDGSIIAINPTLVAVAGSTLRFDLEDCLQPADIAVIAGYNPLDAAAPDNNPPGSFKVIQAMEMQPTGYVNVHTHGLHGRRLPGTTTSAAADEVLTTFVAPLGHPSSESTVSSRQQYSIAIPKNQDAGLYWYHPHLHGEAQPQVFLGLTGAIVVVRRFPHDQDGSRAIAAELARHTNPSLHPAVFIVRDYPVEKFATIAASGLAPGEPAPTAVSRRASHASRQHRAQFLKSAASIQALTTAPKILKGQENPLCSTFDEQSGSPLCPEDHVTPQGGDEAPSLATLVTVNGRLTEVPKGTDKNGNTASLQFQPLSFFATDRTLRVLNASANTFVRLGLSRTPLTSVDLSKASTTVTLTEPLLQLRRDGAPVRHQLRAVKSILVPPGGRAEFVAAQLTPAPLSLVSLFFDTGAAGDTVPPRTLATLGTVPPPLTPAVPDEAASIPEFSTRFQSAYVHAKPKDMRRAFAFYEQDRPCSATTQNPDPDCGTSFYLLDVTSSAIGVNGEKHPVKAAIPFSMPMNADGTPSRDVFQANGLFKRSTPNVQVALLGRREIDEEWDVYNFTGEAHAFHIHQLGFHVTQACSPQFLVKRGLSGNCATYTGAAGDEHHEIGLVLDVINVPPAYSKSVSGGSPLIYPGRVHVRVPFTSDITGNFVMHCHLLEHEDNGMMIGVQVWKGNVPK